MTFHIREDGRAGPNGTTVVDIKGAKQIDTNLWRLDIEIRVPSGVLKRHVNVSKFVVDKYRGKEGLTGLGVTWKQYRPYTITFPGYINQRGELVECPIKTS